MKAKRLFWMSLVGILWVWACSPEAFAQKYPTKPIRVIVPFSAGGSNDLIGRALAKCLTKELKGSIVVENIPAGTTKVGVLEVLKAEPDGHTLLFAGHKALMGIYYAGTYDFRVWEKLTIIGQSGEMPYGFLEVRAESPFQTWADLVKYAKQNPGKLTCGGPVAGGMMHLIAMETAKAAGIEMKYVPFAGAGPSGTAVLGGHVDYRICLIPDTMTNIKAGNTRGLGISYGKRLPQLPEIPTFKELGLLEEIPNFTYDYWGPPNMSPQLVNLIGKAVEKGVNDPDYIQFCQRIAYQPIFKDAQRLKEEMNNFEEKMGPKLAAFYKK